MFNQGRAVFATEVTAQNLIPASSLYGEQECLCQEVPCDIWFVEVRLTHWALIEPWLTIPTDQMAQDALQHRPTAWN